MTDAELREIAENATPGPWRIAATNEFPWTCEGCGVPGEPTFTVIGSGGYGVLSMPISIGDHNVTGCTNGEFIAAFNPATALALLDRLERAEKALEPFARVAEADIGESETDADRFAPMVRHNRAPHITVGDMRNARAALSEAKR